MNKTKTNRSFVIAAFAVLAIVSIIVYSVLRTLFVFRAQYSLIEKIMGITLLISEMYILLHAVGYFTGIYRLYTRPAIQPGRVELNQFPSVAILIPARHEPKDILESTILGCYNQSYPSKTISMTPLNRNTKTKRKN
jgi:cellulose synthase (UDP-forming)